MNLIKYVLLIFMLNAACLYAAVDGMLDRAFAQGQSYEELTITKAIICDSEERMVVAGYIQNLGKKTFAVARLLANGKFDHSFGKNGIVCTPFTNGETASCAQAILVDSTGKIVAAGFTNGINNICHACLARYNNDGSLDKSFFGGRAVFKGTVISLFGSLEEVSHLNGLVETLDRKIVAVGTTCENKSARFALARYNDNGSLDITFNAAGKGSPAGMVCTQIDSSPDDEAFAVALDAHGKMVVAGSSCASGVKTFALARYCKDGSLDHSFFGGNTTLPGTVVTNFLHGETEAGARAVAIQGDGKIVAAGYTNAFCSDSQSNHFAIARYTAQGVLDSEFRSENGTLPGTLVDNFGNENVRSCINALMLQPDNKIVVGGYAEFNKIKYFALARYENNGSCDYSFNNGQAPYGKVLSRCSNTNSDELFGLSLTRDGDIVAAGRSQMGAMCHGVVARYMCDQDMYYPQIHTSAQNNIVIKPAEVTVSGKAQPGSRINVYLNERLVNILEVTSNKSWDCKLPMLNEGDNCVYVCEKSISNNLLLKSDKLKIVVELHPMAVNQIVECQGMRDMHGSLVARGASGDYSFRIVKENDCKVSLIDDKGSFKVNAAIASGNASFEFEVKDNITQCTSNGIITLAVHEIPITHNGSFEITEDQKLTNNLSFLVEGGQKPYAFKQAGSCTDGECIVSLDGSFSFTPIHAGESAFNFIATDRLQIPSELGHIVIQVYSLPKAKQCRIDEYGNKIIKGKLSSAFDGYQPYVYSLVSEPQHCKVTMKESGHFTCVPEENYYGSASFEYLVTDSKGNCSKPGKVMLQLHKKVEIPSIKLSVNKNSVLKKNMNDLLSYNQTYQYQLKGDMPEGKLTISEQGELEFIPSHDFVGKTKCTIKISDPSIPAHLTPCVKVEIDVTD